MNSPARMNKNVDAGPLSSSLPNLRQTVWPGDEVASKKLKPFIIGVAGGTASGKTSVCKLILNRLGDHRVAIISQDCFYKNLSDEEKQKARDKEYNFDHPGKLSKTLF